MKHRHKREKSESGLRRQLASVKSSLTEHNNNTWALLSMSVVIAALIVAWWVVSDAFSVSGIDKVAESDSAVVANPVIAANSQLEEITALKDTLRDLNETARMLMDSITFLETKLIRAHVLSDGLIADGEALTAARLEQGSPQPGANPPGNVALIESLPPPAAGTPPADKGAAGEQPQAAGRAVEKPAEVGETPAGNVVAAIEKPVNRKPARREPEASVAPKPVKTAAAKAPEKQPDTVHTTQIEPNSERTGEWTINLASLRSLKQAENFKSKAGMKGFDTSIQQVNVKGNDYWRVRITGLATLDEAHARGEAIKQRLGLKEIWISRQR